MAGNEQHSMSDRHREEVAQIAKDEIIRAGLDANGPETRQKNIQRMQFIDKMFKLYTSTANKIGQALIWFLIAALFAWWGIKGGFGN